MRIVAVGLAAFLLSACDQSQPDYSQPTQYAPPAQTAPTAQAPAAPAPAPAPAAEPSPEATTEAQPVEEVATAPKGREVRCVVESSGGRFEGPCQFQNEAGGSFSLSMADESEISPGISMVSVSIYEPGKAEVSGLTTEGNNSRWGSAERSTADAACWTGSDFNICAY